MRQILFCRKQYTKSALLSCNLIVSRPPTTQPARFFCFILPLVNPSKQMETSLTHNIPLPPKGSNIPLDRITFQKMVLLFNTLEDGWTVRKRGTVYIFTKQHEGKREVFEESYLQRFLEQHSQMDHLPSLR